MVVELASGFAVVGAGAWLFGRAQPAAVRGAFSRRSLRGFVCPDRGSLAVGELAAGGSQVPSRKSQVPDSKPADDGSDMRPADLGPETAAAGRQAAAAAWCSAADRPFLTRIDCGVPVSAISEKVLVAPAAARAGARLLRVVPMSFARSLRTTVFSLPDERAQSAPRTPAQPASNAAGGGLERGEAASNGGGAAWVVMATRSRTARIALADGESLGVRPEAAVAWTGARPTGFCPRLRLLDVLLPRGPRDLLLHFHGPAIVWVEGSESLPLRRGVPGKAVF